MSRAATTTGIWLIAGTWTHTRYPCRCDKKRRCRTSANDPHGHPAYWCPCWGRTDVDDLPIPCCAPNHPIHAKEAQPA